MSNEEIYARLDAGRENSRFVGNSMSKATLAKVRKAGQQNDRKIDLEVAFNNHKEKIFKRLKPSIERAIGELFSSTPK